MERPYHIPLSLVSLLALLLIAPHTQATPTDPSYFDGAFVNHFTSDPVSSTYTQRYYESSTYFKGPGHPIFLVMGGEGTIEPSTGLFYPYINEVLASKFGAYVIEPEHRFYGESLPVVNATNDDLKLLMTPEQALYDAVTLVNSLRKDLGCTAKGTPTYCPVISVGGSYPGFLSFSMRLLFPQHIDASYAASAPVKFYAQQVDGEEYYDLIAKSAERSLPGCAKSIETTLSDFKESLVDLTYEEVASKLLNICPSIPSYIDNNEKFYQEVQMVIAYTFAGLNMANYPPNDDTELNEVCKSWTEKDSDWASKFNFLFSTLIEDGEDSCFDLNSQLPAGSKGTISSGDWSGVGSGADGKMWDYQTCSLLVERIDITETFGDRTWTLDWMNDHCQDRFGISPSPNLLAKTWGFDDILSTPLTRVLFTNGLNDGWSVGSITETLSEERQLVAMNFPNGAHHSDLSHSDPGPDDTEDIQKGHEEIAELLGQWLEEIMKE
ncbi:hypothetical protein TrLO_g15817 [Triparma laevis f. longispina]|uniref:Uncharacterized protein n=1 Tax=Triparma laevis f. longispina TaxID=1714387 RepID=A0A9W7AXA4_9STRA|nr:hypothetical protein TrLO_g15817 [Triparma laevis f. longispina]